MGSYFIKAFNKLIKSESGNFVKIDTYGGDAGAEMSMAATSTVDGTDATINYVIANGDTDTWTVTCEDQTATGTTGSFEFTNLAAGDYTYTVIAKCAHDIEITTDVTFTIEEQELNISLDCYAYTNDSSSGDGGTYASVSLMDENGYAYTAEQDFDVTVTYTSTEGIASTVGTSTISAGEDNCLVLLYFSDEIRTENSGQTVTLDINVTNGSTAVTGSCDYEFEKLCDFGTAKLSITKIVPDVSSLYADVYYNIEYSGDEGYDLYYKVNDGEWNFEVSTYGDYNSSFSVSDLNYGDNTVSIYAVCSDHGTETTEVTKSVELNITAEFWDAKISSQNGTSAVVYYNLDTNVTDGWTITVTTEGTTESTELTSIKDWIDITYLPYGDSTIYLDAVHESGYGSASTSIDVHVDEPEVPDDGPAVLAGNCQMTTAVTDVPFTIVDPSTYYDELTKDENFYLEEDILNKGCGDYIQYSVSIEKFMDDSQLYYHRINYVNGKYCNAPIIKFYDADTGSEITCDYGYESMYETSSPNAWLFMPVSFIREKNYSVRAYAIAECDHGSKVRSNTITLNFKSSDF